MGPSRDFSVALITFVVFFLPKTSALEGDVLSASHCSACRARVQDCLVLPVSWRVASVQPSSSERLFFIFPLSGISLDSEQHLWVKTHFSFTRRHNFSWSAFIRKLVELAVSSFVNTRPPVQHLLPRRCVPFCERSIHPSDTGFDSVSSPS